MGRTSHHRQPPGGAFRRAQPSVIDTAAGCAWVHAAAGLKERSRCEWLLRQAGVEQPTIKRVDSYTLARVRQSQERWGSNIMGALNRLLQSVGLEV